MIRRAITGLCKIELPAHTIRLCDGGRIVWGAETFAARDDTYGTLGAVKPLSEGIGDDLPPLEMTLLPPSTTAAADLVQPAFQGSRVRFWLAEFDIDTAAVSGTPELRFDGELDQASLNLIDLSLDLMVTAKAARLFELNIGNSQNPAFHKSVWAGETGHDNATGLSLAVAWGTDAPPQAARFGGGASPAFDPLAGGVWF